MTSELLVLDLWRDAGSTTIELRTTVANRPAAVAGVAARPGADGVALWDPRLPRPHADLVTSLLDGACHVWHAGLLLGQGDRPTLWRHCHPRAMFSLDVDPAQGSMSWRVSLRALVARSEVFTELGGIDPSFETSSGAGLDVGMRWLRGGALLRHEPGLVAAAGSLDADPVPTLHDEARFVTGHMGRTWAIWAAARGVATRTVPLRHLPAVRRGVKDPRPPPQRKGLSSPDAPRDPEARVTVLLPTVGRYPFVEPLLRQLEEQTVAPHQVVVVDQNPPEERHDLHQVAPGLPLEVHHLLPPGQCTARNLGLQRATGTHILFLDDDDEIPPDLIEEHLRVLAPAEVMVSGGLVDDAESGPAPASLRFRQMLQTFPTNNAMIKRAVLERTGLFDPTYDRGSRADHDLGMRSYLAGHLHVYDPGPQVFHHHAPMGGLRTHGARIRTRGNSRSTLTERHLRPPTDIYLGLRYYSRQQVHESLVLATFATLGGGGSGRRRAMRMAVQVALLPDTWRRTKQALARADRLLDERPEIPQLEPAER